MDDDIVVQVNGMSDEYVQSQIDKMREEADKMEKKLKTMTLKERAKVDQYHHFSLAEFDYENQMLLQEYNFRKQLLTAVEESEVKMEDLEEKLQDALTIKPDLQEWYDNYHGAQMLSVTNLAQEMIKDGALKIEQEELEKLLTEISNKEGLENSEVA